MIRRGQLWWAELGPPRGSAPTVRRPVLIISDDRYNTSHLATVTVVALTSTTRLGALPGNVAIAAEASGLDVDSVVNVTQVATVDRDALHEVIGPLPDWILAQVDDGLRRALRL